ncbi:MAG: IS4 family transposase [Saprospiraceae bacterium]
MLKDKYFTGQPIFSQILQLIPRDLVNRMTRKFKADHYVKSFNSYEHLVSMLFFVFQRCNSLREVSTGMQAWMNRLSHLGIKSFPKRSTFAEANQRRPAAFFEDLFHGMLQKYNNEGLADSRQEKQLNERLFFIDSSTMELFNDIMRGAGMSKKDGRRKGGVKVHMMVNSSHLMPKVVYLTEARENDRVFMDKVTAPKGSILVFDKGYIKFSQWQEWTKQGLYWVTRLSNVAYYEVLEDRVVNENQKQSGILEDQTILLGRGSSNSTEVILARRVMYYDAGKDRIFEFVTNHEKFSPKHIADLYKKRWEIETVFKSIKHNYQLKYFLGNNPNAVCIQIWCSLIADLLLKVIKRSVKQRVWAFSNLCSMIRMHLGTYVNLWEFLKSPENALPKKINNETKQYSLLLCDTT